MVATEAITAIILVIIIIVVIAKSTIAILSKY
jgi:hypothetical protein